MDLAALASWTRAELVDRARQLGVERPERMTRIELRDEIQRLASPRSSPEAPRGLFGTARSMLASMVEAGLNMPEAAAVIRGEAGFDVRVKTHPPVATVTLAEIYAAQGHRQRAIRMLEDVLAAEPDHEVARELKRRLEAELEQKGSDTGATAEGSRDTELVETTGEEVRTGRPPEVVVTDPSRPSEEVTDADGDVPPSPPNGEETSLTANDPPGNELEAANHSDETSEDELDGAGEADAPPGDELETAGGASETSNDELDPTPQEALLEAPAAVAEAAREPDLGSPGETSEVLPAGPTALPVSEHLGSLELPESDALFFRRESDGTRLYWELSLPSADRAGRRMPEGKPIVRVVGVRPALAAAPIGSPTRLQIDVDVSEASGVAHVAELRSPVVVRAALGWLGPEGFVPFAVGSDLDGSYRPPSGEADSAARVRARDHLG